jgi:hypothetical protein
VSSNVEVQARLHVGADASFVWVVNPTAREQETELSVDGGGFVADILWGAPDSVRGATIVVPAQDAVVFACSPGKSRQA